MVAGWVPALALGKGLQGEGLPTFTTGSICVELVPKLPETAPAGQLPRVYCRQPSNFKFPLFSKS